MNQLTPAERGVVHILWSLLRTQMDEPGVFIKSGSILDPTGVGRLVKPHCSGGGARLDIVSKWVSTVLQCGPFRQREDGAYYSPRIVREAQVSTDHAFNGKKGAEKRWSQRTHYNRAEKEGAMKEAIAPAMARSDQSRAEQKQSSGARAPALEGESQEPEVPEAPEPEASVTAERAIRGIEELTGLELANSDRDRIVRSTKGKVLSQVEYAIERIRDAYNAGSVKSIVAFSCRVIEDAPAPTRDRSDDAHITAAKLACDTLGIAWSEYHMPVLRAVKENPTRTTKAMRATFEDVRAKIITDSAPSILERFLMRMETAMEAAAASPG